MVLKDRTGKGVRLVHNRAAVGLCGLSNVISHGSRSDDKNSWRQ
jgi:hypothetical protein